MGGQPTLRLATQRKAGPIVTDNGMFIIDCTFNSEDMQPGGLSELNQKLSLIPGVVDHGLFIQMATKAYFGGDNGKVTTLER
jgi:ribose 5-phosphate isomerase A